jgi:hypothetical protein
VQPAVGTPAKVIRSAPAFPRTVTPEDKAALVRTIVSEFERFATYKEVQVADVPPFRTYARNGKTWRLLWVHADDAPGVAALTRAGDTVLSETALDAATRADLEKRGAYWLDLAGRTRSEAGSPLTEELALFLGRYGIRLPRD